VRILEFVIKLGGIYKPVRRLIFMENKISQKGWQTVVIWLGLLAAAAFTSEALYEAFYQIVSTLFGTIVGDVGALFQNYGVLFATILAIALIFLIVSAWLNLVSFTFDIIDIVFEAEEEVEDSVYPANVVRYLAFSWGLYFILFLILPFVYPA
jgi:hypothetical protein